MTQNLRKVALDAFEKAEAERIKREMREAELERQEKQERQEKHREKLRKQLSNTFGAADGFEFVLGGLHEVTARHPDLPGLVFYCWGNGLLMEPEFEVPQGPAYKDWWNYSENAHLSNKYWPQEVKGLADVGAAMRLLAEKGLKIKPWPGGHAYVGQNVHVAPSPIYPLKKKITECEWQMRPNQLSGFDIVDAFGLIETVASEDQAQHIVTAHNAAIRRAR